MNNHNAEDNIDNINNTDDTDWTIAWQDPSVPIDPEVVTWVRAQPRRIQEILRLFPPACLVRGERPLICPKPGSVGIVYAYSESETVRVLQSPSGTIAAECQLDWLTVVGYRGSITPEWVTGIIDSKG